MDEPVFQVGQEITVDGVRDGRPVSAVAFLVEVRAEVLVLDLADPRSPVGGLEPNAPVRIKFFDAQGISMADTTLFVAGLPTAARVVVRRPRRAVVLRARVWFRVAIALPMRLTVVQSKRAPVSAAIAHDVDTVDVSGGGTRFTTTLPLAEGDVVNLRMDLAGHTFVADARVVRLFAGPPAAVAVEYTAVPSGDRERLVAFLVDAHRAARERDAGRRA